MTSIWAFIEYRISSDGRSRSARAVDLTHIASFVGGKDYKFIAAISGCRNESPVGPLYPMRGMPPNASATTKAFIERHFEEPYTDVGWLFLREILAALDHMGVARTDLSLLTNMVLAMMAFFETELGADGCRLVFGID